MTLTELRAIRERDLEPLVVVARDGFVYVGLMQGFQMKGRTVVCPTNYSLYCYFEREGNWVLDVELHEAVTFAEVLRKITEIFSDMIPQ